MSYYRLLPEIDFFRAASDGFMAVTAFGFFPALQVLYGERQNADICPA
ncbi:hypothetical protein [Pseudomonas caricapapayae]|nr:hypothetical protein [Pseudomonas caricapapayae]